MNLTPKQIDYLKSAYVEQVVDNMSTKDLEQYVSDDLFNYYDKQGEHEFLEEARNYWDDSFDEVVEEVKDYMKCDFKKDKGTTTYSLEVGETISFPVHNPDS